MGTRILLVGLVLLAGCGPVAGGAPNAPGKAAEAFTLPSLDGGSHSLSEYRGKVVIVNFWATWCIPCRAEIPDLEHEYRAHRTDLVVLGVDWKESRADVQAFTAEIGVTYPVLLDSSGSVHDRYEVGGLPQTFVLDRRGKVVVSRVGIGSRDTLESEYRKAAAA